MHTDPIQIIDYFYVEKKSEYVISNHCMHHEVQRNKRLNIYNHTTIDKQFLFYLSDGLHKLDQLEPNKHLPSCIVLRTHIFHL